ncbi:MAG TPA: membrane protein insertion efficiency factor YidD [Afifellaceae bacterium]|nr:membrane protein insertion efficiency factor YidD [Afifellaceae bacterium]
MIAARVLIRAYQLTLSAFFGRTCRHMPTCSEYADEAITRHGLWAGGWMTLARLWRCRPFGSHGYDPVPDTLPAGGLIRECRNFRLRRAPGQSETEFPWSQFLSQTVPSVISQTA